MIRWLCMGVKLVRLSMEALFIEMLLHIGKSDDEVLVYGTHLFNFPLQLFRWTAFRCSQYWMPSWNLQTQLPPIVFYSMHHFTNHEFPIAARSNPEYFGKFHKYLLLPLWWCDARCGKSILPSAVRFQFRETEFGV